MKNTMKFILSINLAFVFSNSVLAEGEVTANTAGFGAEQFIMIGILLLVFYFLLWRPQSKKQKVHREMVASIKVGDEITLATGILGIIKKIVNDNYIQVSISDNAEVIIQKSAVAGVMPKGTIKDLGGSSVSHDSSKKSTSKAKDKTEEKKDK